MKEKNISNLRKKYLEFLEQKPNKKQKVNEEKLTTTKSIDLVEEKAAIPELIDLTKKSITTSTTRKIIDISEIIEKADEKIITNPFSRKIECISEIIKKSDEIKKSEKTQIVFIKPTDPDLNLADLNAISKSNFLKNNKIPSVYEEMFSFSDVFYQFLFL